MAAAVRRVDDGGGDAAAHERTQLSGSAHKKMRMGAAGAAHEADAEAEACITCEVPSAASEPALQLVVVALREDRLFAPRCVVAFVAAARQEGGSGSKALGASADGPLAGWAADLMRNAAPLDRHDTRYSRVVADHSML